MVVVLAAVAAAVAASAELRASGVVLLLRPTRTLEERSTAEAESASACLALQVESRTLRIGPRMSIHLDSLDHLCGKVLADVKRVA